MIEQNDLTNFPIRIALTDHCNLRCFFCSNEGMDLRCKNLRQINLDHLKYFLEVAKDVGVSGLSLTGGEPSLYPSLEDLLGHVKRLKFSQTFFHTNGIRLTPSLVDNYLSSFSKVAISIHTVNSETWQRLTGGNHRQFTQLMANLAYLSSYSKSDRLAVEIKSVPMRGINDSADELEQLLDFCSDNKFRFKLLNFEPITPDQKSYQIPLQRTLDKVRLVGGKVLPPDGEFRGQKSYLPLNRFKYKDTHGVVIEIGCGQPEVCETCAHSNEIFINPNLEIKPCHASKISFPLRAYIEDKNNQGILGAMIRSREFLLTKPGIGTTHWLN